jgi:hypothetical protein
MRNVTHTKWLIAAALLMSALAAPAARADTFMNGRSFYGQAAAAEATGRVVNLDTAPYLNVIYGETVIFRSSSRQFAWTFNGLDRRAVDVAKIAPAGFSTKPFVIYIAEDPNNRR